VNESGEPNGPHWERTMCQIAFTVADWLLRHLRWARRLFWA